MTRYALRVCIVAVLLHLAVVTASAQDRTTNVVLGSAVVLSFAEIVGTERCVQLGTCHEANPLLPHGTSWEASISRAILKGAGTAVAARLILELKKHGTKGKVAALCAAGGLAAWNGYLLSRTRMYEGAP